MGKNAEGMPKWSGAEFCFGLQMFGDNGHFNQQGFEKGPADSDFKFFFRITDGIPAVTAGRNERFGILEIFQFS